MRYLVWRRRGHQLARELWAAADEVVSASITYVETQARPPGRYWTAPELGRLQREWEAVWADVVVVVVDPLIGLAAVRAGAVGVPSRPISGGEGSRGARASRRSNGGKRCAGSGRPRT
jgi:hypothetical protein